MPPAMPFAMCGLLGLGVSVHASLALAGPPAPAEPPSAEPPAAPPAAAPAPGSIHTADTPEVAAEPPVAPPAAAAASSPSGGARPSAAAAPPADAEVIRVQSRWPDADLFTVGHTTRATTTRRVPQDARAAVLADVLEDIPGLSVQRTGPGQGAPIVRGLIGSAVLIVVDGMRVNNSIFRPAPNQYTALVDPLAISRVEVTRGPGSAMFGSDAIGGVINVITPLPRFEGDVWRQAASAVTAVATADRSVVGRATASAGKAGSGLAVGATVQRHGDLRAGGGERQTPSAYRSVAIDATGHLETDRHATTAWLQVLEQPALPRTDELRPGYGQPEPAAAVFHYQPSRRAFSHVRHLIRRPFGAVEGIELHAAWQRIDDDRRIRDTGAPEELREENRADSLGLAARSVAPVLGGELTVGADYWLDAVRSVRRSRNIDTGDVMSAKGRFADGSTMGQLGAFAEGRRRIGPVALRAAGRAGWTRTRIAAADRMVGAAIRSLSWAGELGAELELAPDVQLVANAGRAYRSPNVHDLSGLGPRPGGRYQVPAADLTDERALGADLGVRARRGRLDAEVFGFGLVNDDRIEVIPTGELTIDGREIVVSANTARTRVLGIEGALRARPRPSLELEAVATWVHGVQRTSAGREPADRTPPASARVEAEWLVVPRLRLEGAVRGALAQRRLSARDRSDPRIDPAGTRAFATLHAGAVLQVGAVEVALRGDNLADRRYREHGSGTEAPGFDASLLVRWAVVR
jgi:outer membrane receptor protein involved in Fe transport